MLNRRLSLKRKLVGVILLTTIAAAVVTYAALLGFEFHSYRGDTDRNLSALAGIIAENSGAALIYDDQALAQENLASLSAESDITAAALYDQKGRLFATYPARVARTSLPGAPGPPGVAWQNGGLHLFQPVTQGGQAVGTLYLASDLRQMYRRFQVYGMVLLTVFLAAFGVAVLLSNFFQERISQPILELAKLAVLISKQKNYAIRARNATDDELGDLAQAFNAMLDQIEASHRDVERARDEAVTASRAKDDFLAALSHELRTPLNPVLLLASDAAQREDLPAAVREDFDTIRKNVELEARLIDDLLDLTRITRGKLTLDSRLTDPRAVLRDAIATVRADAEAKRIDLALEPGSGRPQVVGDPIRLQQIFWNVLKNAVKFTPEGGWIAVRLKVIDASGRVLVTIEDNGIGLTAAEVPRLFQVFSQGEHADGRLHRFGGLGLGLAISRTLVELHGGTISASSPGRGEGASFVIDLPLAVGELGALTLERPPVTAGPPGPAVRQHRILLVEDHAATRILLKRMLESRGHRVQEAESVAGAIASAAAEPFDVLISDIGLPDGSGYELMANLSNHGPVRGIALTGYGMEQDVAASRRAGFAAHLTKPVNIGMVDDALAGLFKEPSP